MQVKNPFSDKLNEELAIELLEVLKECPIKRLDITGNDFPKKIKKAYFI